MTSRPAKQMVYGLFFLILLAGTLTALYFLLLRPKATCFDGLKNQGEEEKDCGGPCEDICAAESLSIIVGEKRFFDIARLRKTTFYIELDNPSADFWVKNFNYVLNVYNNLGVKIASFDGSSSIPPSGKRPIVITAADIDARDISRTDLGIMDPEWASVVEYHVDGISVSTVKAQGVAGERIYVSGTAINNVASVAQNLAVGAIFKGEDGGMINVSSTNIENIQPFSKKDFEIFLTPNQIPRIDLAKTEIFTEVTR